jgi:class 3 adenylate cyclase
LPRRPPELLAHDLGKEVIADVGDNDPAGQPHGRNVFSFRGLRLKAGMDISRVKGSVHAITGKITYRGRVMNRAARIASTATVGQVSLTCQEL